MCPARCTADLRSSSMGSPLLSCSGCIAVSDANSQPQVEVFGAYGGTILRLSGGGDRTFECDVFIL